MPDCRLEGSRGRPKAVPDARVGLPARADGRGSGGGAPVLGCGGYPRDYSAWLTDDMLKPSTRSGGMAERVK